MDGFEELITLTPMNCVKSCNDLLDAADVKPRSYSLFITLFGLYCGALIYRSYRKRTLLKERLQTVQVENPEVQIIVISSDETMNSEDLLTHDYRLEAKNGPTMRSTVQRESIKPSVDF
ncbi:uncharacterized protein Dwil_GK21572 [Drosophila willistoni]|uniref:GK21572 n=1 Tax=Drosophila willistoni TaxID=7260 RepID=B4MPM9_DROWI|nr:uncharacterized protein Dwil_GK21572 [Drosophila willistoni]